MIKEYKCQGSRKTIIILLWTAAIVLVIVTLMGDDFLGYYLKSKYRDKDLSFYVYILILFAADIGYGEVFVHLKTKIQIFQQGVRLIGLKERIIAVKKEKIKAEYSEIKSVSTRGMYVNVNIQGEEYLVFCGSSKEAEECCETIRNLMKQAGKV